MVGTVQRSIIIRLGVIIIWTMSKVEVNAGRVSRNQKTNKQNQTNRAHGYKLNKKNVKLSCKK